MNDYYGLSFMWPGIDYEDNIDWEFEAGDTIEVSLRMRHPDGTIVHVPGTRAYLWSILYHEAIQY